MLGPKKKRDDCSAGRLIDQVASLVERRREQERRIAKLGRKLTEANRSRRRLLNVADAFLRRSNADALRKLGAEELDVHRFALDTPYDGVLIEIAKRHVHAGKSLVQLGTDESIPAPIFAAEVLGAKFERRAIDDCRPPKSVEADMVSIDGRLLSETPLSDLIGTTIRLLTLYPLPPMGDGRPVDEWLKRLTADLDGLGFGNSYVPPGNDYLIVWK